MGAGGGGGERGQASPGDTHGVREATVPPGTVEGGGAVTRGVRGGHRVCGQASPLGGEESTVPPGTVESGVAVPAAHDHAVGVVCRGALSPPTMNIGGVSVTDVRNLAGGGVCRGTRPPDHPDAEWVAEAGGPIAVAVARVRALDLAALSPPVIQVVVDDERVKRDTDVLLQMGSLERFAAHRLRAVRGDGARRMDPLLLRHTLGPFTGLSRLLAVAQGIRVRLTEGFIRVPDRPVPAQYLRRPDLVNAAIVKSHQRGFTALFDHRAYDVLTASGFCCNPSTWVPKRDDPTGRAVLNLSASPRRGTHYTGSVNDHTDSAWALSRYGPAEVDSLAHLCQAALALHERTLKPVGFSLDDLTTAFSLLDFHPSAVRYMGTRVHECGIASYGVSLAGNFGHESTPAALNACQHAVAFITNTQSLLWRCGQQCAASGRDRNCVATHVDDSAVLDVLTGPTSGMNRDLFLQASKHIFAPGVDAPSPIKASKHMPLRAANLFKGWHVDCASWTVTWSARALRKMTRAVFVTIPQGAKRARYRNVESSTSTLSHYALGRPQAAAFLCEARSLLKKYRTCEWVPVTGNYRRDLRWFRALVRLARRWRAAVSVDMRVLAGREPRDPTVVYTDASGYGAGVFFAGHAYYWAWEPAEVLAVAVVSDRLGTNINVLEYIVAVVGLLLAALAGRRGAVRLRIDNTTAEVWTKRVRSRSPEAFDWCRLQELIMSLYDLHVATRWIATLDNVLADALSRWSDPHARARFHQVTAVTPQPLPVPVRRLVRGILLQTTSVDWVALLDPLMAAASSGSESPSS